MIHFNSLDLRTPLPAWQAEGADFNDNQDANDAPKGSALQGCDGLRDTLQEPSETTMML